MASAMHRHRRMRAQTIVARVVIADDDPDTLDLLRRALGSPTTQILEAASGAELIQRLADDGPFDLIVTDIHMPWMRGLDVLRSVRACDVDTPALVVTGESGVEHQVEIARLGNARLLRKPFEIAKLRQAVIELLDHAG
jgi:DNA-binding response OmpR family regulator